MRERTAQTGKKVFRQELRLRLTNENSSDYKHTAQWVRETHECNVQAA